MFDKIMLAVDGSEPSERAVPVAADLAHKYGSEVVVVHVREVDRTWIGGVELEAVGEGRELIDRVVRTLKDEGLSARGEEPTAIYGQAAREILECAKENDAGLVVMGSRGLSDWTGVLIGSVAHKVLHLADRPVLVVR